MTTAELVEAVRAHATAKYNTGGWDILVECWSDAEIVECIGTAKTAAGAIAKCARSLKPHAEYRREVQNA